MSESVRPRVLSVGIYLADQENTARHVSSVLSRSRTLDIEQRWIGLSLKGSPTDVPGTVAVVREKVPRCELINRLIDGFESFDWVIINDDDIEIAEGFADALIAVASYTDLALCQPARTHDSYIDHRFVAQFTGLVARRTRFVEIGPVVCMRRDAARLILPFPGDIQMGWGLDFIWPRRIEDAGLRLGIIDAVPVAHRLRKPVTGYKWEEANAEQQRLLATYPHYTAEQAFRILEVYE